MNDNRYYDTVAAEIQRRFFVPGLWTRAYAEAGGDDSRARALYIQYRVAELAAEEAATDRSTPPLIPATPPEIDQRYKGVGGWLTFFCVGHVILAPIITLVRMSSDYDDAKPAFAIVPGFQMAVETDNMVVCFFLVYGFATAISLWRADPGAAEAVKQYLIFRLCAAPLRYALAVGIPSIPASYRATYAGEVFGSIIIYEVIFFAIWHSYFRRSKRVRATFPQ